MILETQKDPAMIMELCNCFYYQHNPAGRIIFREGDTENTNFYFVLEGSVGVYISSIPRPGTKKELMELESPGWNPENCDDANMLEKNRLMHDYGFPHEDVCVYLPKRSRGLNPRSRNGSPIAQRETQLGGQHRLPRLLREAAGHCRPHF